MTELRSGENDSMPSEPFISVIIASYKRLNSLVPCLESILKNKYEQFEILIVWQGNDVATRDEVIKHFGNEERVKLLYNEELGLTPARNLAAHNATGDILIFTDDDVTVTDSWIEAYAEIFTKISPMPGAAGGKSLPVWSEGRPKWYPKEREFLLGLYDIGDEIKEFPGEALPFGANFAIPKSVFFELRGIDNRLGFKASKKAITSGADSLLALRARDKGYKLYYHPKAQIFHHVVTSKLSRKFFLKRHYYEGKSFLRMQIYRGNIKRNRLNRIVVFHLSKICKDIAVLTKILLTTYKDKDAKVMLSLAQICVSLGTCVQSLEFLLRPVKETS